jgi:hypothetical protein
MVFAVYLFQNHILYGCGHVKQVLPSMSFDLPPPIYSFQGAKTTFYNDGSDKDLYYFHGNGIKAENTWWHMQLHNTRAIALVYLARPLRMR